jgi:hypothetical protein
VNAIPAEQCQDLKETRTHRFSRHPYTHGMDEQRGFHTTRLGHGA